MEETKSKPDTAFWLSWSAVRTETGIFLLLFFFLLPSPSPPPFIFVLDCRFLWNKVQTKMYLEKIVFFSNWKWIFLACCFCFVAQYNYQHQMTKFNAITNVYCNSLCLNHLKIDPPFSSPFPTIYSSLYKSLRWAVAQSLVKPFQSSNDQWRILICSDM